MSYIDYIRIYGLPAGKDEVFQGLGAAALYNAADAQPVSGGEPNEGSPSEPETPETPDLTGMAGEVLSYLTEWTEWLSTAIETYRANMGHAEEEGTRFLPAVIAAAPVLTPALVASTCVAVPAVGAALVGTNVVSGVLRASMEQKQIDTFDVFLRMFNKSLFAKSDGKSVGLAELLRLLEASFRRKPIEDDGEVADDTDEKMSMLRKIELWTKFLAAQDGVTECPYTGWCINKHGELTY